MKYTRFEFKYISSKSVMKYFYTALILIPIMAIGIGLIISKSMFISHIPSIENRNDDNTYTYENAKIRKFYIVQTGVFSSPINAQSFAGTIRSSGFPAYINSQGQYFFIIVSVNSNSNAANMEAKKYIAAGNDYVIKELNILPNDLPDDLKIIESNIFIAKTINGLGDFIEKTLNLMDQYESKSIDSIAFKEDAIVEYKSLTNITVRFKETRVQEMSIFDEILESCDLYNMELEKIDKSNNLLNAELKEDMIKIVYSYQSLIDNFNNVMRK